MVGLEVCHFHGGGTKKSKVKSAVARIVRDSPRIALIDEGDPEANGATALVYELRRTIGRIRFAEDNIAKLKSDEDMIFGVSEIEAKNAPTNYGPNGAVSDASFERTQWEAKVNGWVESERWNRAHLLKITALWINAGFEERRLKLEEERMDIVEAAINGLIADLGSDPADPDVRRKVRDRLAGMA